jgi:hypothetical protein
MENIGQQIHHLFCCNDDLAFSPIGLIFVTPNKQGLSIFSFKNALFLFFLNK